MLCYGISGFECCFDLPDDIIGASGDDVDAAALSDVLLKLDLIWALATGCRFHFDPYPEAIQASGDVGLALEADHDPAKALENLRRLSAPQDLFQCARYFRDRHEQSDVTRDE